MIPQAVKVEVVRQQEAMGWPEYVPAFAEMPNAKGQILIKHYNELTVGDCEQLVEHHSRKATKAIERFKATLSRHSLKTAGRNILYARLYRCRYIGLLGIEGTTEADMPLPLD